MKTLPSIEERVEEFYQIECHSVDTVPVWSTQTAVGALEWIKNTLTQDRAKAEEEMKGITKRLKKKRNEVAILKKSNRKMQKTISKLQTEKANTIKAVREMLEEEIKSGVAPSCEFILKKLLEQLKELNK